MALAIARHARWWLGRDGWRQDLDDAVAMARNSDPLTHGAVVTCKYGWTIFYGVLRADDSAVREIEEALQIAEGSSDDTAVGVARFALGVALVHRDAAADRQRGLELLAQVRDMWLRERDLFYGIPLLDLYVARESARRGDRDGAIPVMRKAVDDLLRAGRLGYGVIGAATFWWRRCWSVAPRATWPKPKWRSTGWRTCRRRRLGGARHLLLRLRALLARCPRRR